MPDALGGGFHLYFDVVAETVQAVHELALGHVSEVATKQTGHLGLWQSHAPARFFLRQAQATHRLDDLNNQAGFDFQFFRVPQTQIRSDRTPWAVAIPCAGPLLLATGPGDAPP